MAWGLTGLWLAAAPDLQQGRVGLFIHWCYRFGKAPVYITRPSPHDCGHYGLIACVR